MKFAGQYDDINDIIDNYVTKVRELVNSYETDIMVINGDNVYTGINEVNKINTLTAEETMNLIWPIEYCDSWCERDRPSKYNYTEEIYNRAWAKIDIFN